MAALRHSPSPRPSPLKGAGAWNESGLQANPHVAGGRGGEMSSDIQERIRERAKKIMDPAGREAEILEDRTGREIAWQSGVALHEIYREALKLGVCPYRYIRNMDILSVAEQLRLAESRVAVVGAGGLGGQAIVLLARLGVGTLVVVDCDQFDETNLNRQALCVGETLGEPKTRAAVEAVAAINPGVQVIPHQVRLTADVIDGILAGSDVVVDGLDNVPDRLLLQEAAGRLGIPMVHGALAGFEGRIMTILPGGLRGQADEEVTPTSGDTSSTMAGTTVPGTPVPGTPVPGTPVPGTTVPGTTILGTTTTAEPVLILDTPAIYAPVPGPEPAAAPSSGGAAFALEPIEGVSLDERGFLENLDHLTSSSQSGGEFPDPTRTAVGEIPGTSYRLFAARGVNGFSNDPDAGKPGECYYLFGIREQPSQASTDCFTSSDSPTLTPLWSGLESHGMYAWADLPPEASVAVLMVDGSAEMWQQPLSGVVAFSYGAGAGDVSLVVLDASGAEIAHGDRARGSRRPPGPSPDTGTTPGSAPTTSTGKRPGRRWRAA